MNRITLAGVVDTMPEYSHSILGENFYIFYLSCERMSGIADRLKCCVAEIFLPQIECGEALKIEGDVRVRKNKGNQSQLLDVYVFVGRIIEDYNGDENEVVVEGFTCKTATYRETPLGRQIADFIVASNRLHGKSDYIPCIAWGRNAVRMAEIGVGTPITVVGRLQSRTYIKKLDSGETEERTAYELSASKIEVVGNGNKN